MGSHKCLDCLPTMPTCHGPTPLPLFRRTTSGTGLCARRRSSGRGATQISSQTASTRGASGKTGSEARRAGAWAEVQPRHALHMWLHLPSSAHSHLGSWPAGWLAFPALPVLRFVALSCCFASPTALLSHAVLRLRFHCAAVSRFLSHVAPTVPTLTGLAAFRAFNTSCALGGLLQDVGLEAAE